MDARKSKIGTLKVKIEEIRVTIRTIETEIVTINAKIDQDSYAIGDNTLLNQKISGDVYTIEIYEDLHKRR